MDNHRTIYTEVDEEITSIIERVKKTPVEEIALVIPRRSFLSQSIVNLKLLKNQSEKYGKKILLVTRDSLCRSLAEKVGIATSKKLDSETLNKTEIDTLMPRGVQSPNLAIIPNQKDSPRQTIKVTVSGTSAPTPLSMPKEAVKVTEIKSPVPAPQPMITQASNSLDMVKPENAKPALVPNVLELEDIDEEDDYPEIKRDTGPQGFNMKIKLMDVFKAALGKKSSANEEVPTEEEFPAPESFSKVAILNKDDLGTPVVAEKPTDGLQPRGFVRDVGLPSRPSLNVIEKGKTKKIVLLPVASSRIFLGFLAVLVFVVFLTAAFVLPKGEVRITPKKELVVANIDVSASPVDAETDVSKQTIPMKDISEDVREEKEFPATGAVRGGDSSRVSGVLTAYNEFSSSTETFVTHTRFMTDGGLVFRSKAAIKIPGYTKKGGVIVPGSALIEVIADGGGDEYMIDKQKLNVPGLSGGDRYGRIYAVAESPMKKPAEAGSKTVTAGDIRSARIEMQKYMQNLAKEKIREQGKDMAITEESTTFENFKADSDLPAGASGNTFKLKGEITVHAKGYNLEDLKKVADAYLADHAQKNIILTSTSDIKVESSALLKDGKTTSIKLYAERDGVKKLDPEDFKVAVLGMPSQEAKDKLMMMESVKDVTINLWPFWVKSVPGDANKVSISVEY